MNYIKKIYFWSTGYSYTNLGRLFLRLFVGLMLLQFGIRQIIHYDMDVVDFPSTLGMTPEASLIIMIIIEIGCSFFIMCGFLTRIMTIPPLLAMMLAEYHLLVSSSEASHLLSWHQPGFLPIMFLGIYFFILLVGPGKISVDYFLSLYLIHNDNMSETAQLEEV